MKIATLLLVLAAGICSAYQPSAEELAEIHAAFDRWRSVVAEAPFQKPEEAIPRLGRGVWKLNQETIYPVEERLVVFSEVQKALLSIPGHAEYFAAKIRSDELLFESGRGHEVQGGPLWDFETLGQLPSAETVKVLGNFLDDEKNRIEPAPGADVAPIAANNLLAARALHSLKIANPPLQQKPGGYDDIQPWRLWFAQVEAGTRTFRFEGNPQEYSLSGPVAEAKEPVLAAKGAPPPPSSPAGIEPPRPFPMAAVVASLGMLAVAVWLALGGNKRNRRPR